MALLRDSNATRFGRNSMTVVLLQRCSGGGAPRDVDSHRWPAVSPTATVVLTRL